MINLLQWFLVDSFKGGTLLRTALTGSFHSSGDSGTAAIKQGPATSRMQQPVYLHTGERMVLQKRTAVRQIEGDNGKSRGSKRILGVAKRGEVGTYHISRSLAERIRIHSKLTRGSAFSAHLGGSALLAAGPSQIVQSWDPGRSRQSCAAAGVRLGNFAVDSHRQNGTIRCPSLFCIWQ